MAYIDTQNQKSLERIAASIEKIQKDLRSIAQILNDQKSGSSALDHIEQVKRLHDAGLSDGQIETLLGVDFLIIKNIIDRYEQDKETSNG